MTPRWQTVLFDLDGTLCDTIGLIIASYQHSLREVLGYEEDEQVIRGWIGKTLADTFSAHEQAALLESTYVEYNLANLARLQRSYEGVRELVAELDAAGVRCGIVTSKRTATAHLSLEAAGLDAMIEVLGAMEDSTHHKPHPEPLLNALAKLGSTGEGVVYVGDATVDLLAASAAGLAGVGVLWGAGVRADLEVLPHEAICATVSELREALFVTSEGVVSADAAENRT